MAPETRIITHDAVKQAIQRGFKAWDKANVNEIIEYMVLPERLQFALPLVCEYLSSTCEWINNKQVALEDMSQADRHEFSLIQKSIGTDASWTDVEWFPF
jgi:hypothetical protein